MYDSSSYDTLQHYSPFLIIDCGKSQKKLSVYFEAFV